MTDQPSPDANRWHSACRSLSAADPVLGAVIDNFGPCALDPAFDSTPFYHLTHAITHQQLNGTAAKTILQRFLNLYPGAPHPSPEQVLRTRRARLRAVGLSQGKIAAIFDLADKTIAGVVPASGAEFAELTNEEIVDRLTTVRGIGVWTVQMMLMFQLGRPDVLPVDDFGVRQGFQLAYGLKSLPHPKALEKFGARWAPWRSIAAWYLWRAVDLHREGRLPPPPHPPPRVHKPRRVRKARRTAQPQRASTSQRAAKSKRISQRAVKTRANKRVLHPRRADQRRRRPSRSRSPR